MDKSTAAPGGVASFYKQEDKTMSEYYNNVLTNGALIARGSSNWDYYLYNGIVYSMPKPESGAGASVWCSVLNLKRHFAHIQYMRKSARLIPDDWQVVNPKFFESLGIM